MKIIKNLFCVIMIFTLIIPVIVRAEEHTHKFTSSISSNTTSSESYCSIITYTNTQTCNCGYQIVTENTEYVPHQWKLFCVDQNNEGYLKMCTICGRTTGSVIYPMSINVVEEKY